MTFHPPEHPDYSPMPPPVAMSQGRNALLHAGYALAKVDLDLNIFFVKLVSFAGKVFRDLLQLRRWVGASVAGPLSMLKS